MQLVSAGERHVELEEEAVELRLGERVRPLHLERILRGQHHEGFVEDVRSLAHADPMLLHRLEQSALRLGGCSVHLVGQDDVGEDRTFAKLEHLAAALGVVDDRRAQDVRGHEIRRELDAREREREGLGERSHQHRLAQARDALEQRVPARQHARDDAVDDLAISDDRFRYLGPKLVDALAKERHLLANCVYVCHERLRSFSRAKRTLPRRRALCTITSLRAAG